MMRTYYSMLIERSERDTVGKMKQFATYFTHGVRHGAQLRAEIYRAQEAPAILDWWTLLPSRAGADSVKKVQLITDGACLGNPARADGPPFCATTATRERCSAPRRTPPTTAWS